MTDPSDDVEEAIVTNENGGLLKDGRRRSSVRERTSSKRLTSNATSGMENSAFRFQDVNYVVGKGDKEKFILSDVSHKIRSGRK